MNRVILTGNLARDPEVRYTQSGKAVATFSIAVNRTWKKATDAQTQQLTDFINIVAWEKSAEFCSKYLAKGSRILVEGRLQTRTYDAQDGTKRYITEVVSENIEFAGAKRQEGGGDAGSYGDSFSNNNSRPPEPSYGGGNNDMIDNSGMNSKDEDIDIPF